MKKQTAAEWLHMKLDVYFELFPSEWQKLNQIIEEAKEMERDQIIDAYLQGSFNWERQGATQFYNETYGGDK